MNTIIPPLHYDDDDGDDDDLAKSKKNPIKFIWKFDFGVHNYLKVSK